MRSITWFLAVLALLALAGCSAANAHQAEQAVAEAKKDEAAVASDESAEATPIPKEFEPPFPKNEDFFTPPQVDVSHFSATTKNADGTPQVRVLGFVKVEGGSDRAIVQIGPLTDIVEPGNVVQGVEVISLQEPSITLQFNGARWNSSMFDQPVTTELASNSRTNARGNRSFDRGPRATPALPTLAGPGRMPQLPPAPTFPGIPMPPIPQ